MKHYYKLMLLHAIATARGLSSSANSRLCCSIGAWFKRVFFTVERQSDEIKSKKVVVPMFIGSLLFFISSVGFSQQLGTYPLTGVAPASCPNLNNVASGQAA